MRPLRAIAAAAVAARQWLRHNFVWPSKPLPPPATRLPGFISEARPQNSRISKVRDTDGQVDSDDAEIDKMQAPDAMLDHRKGVKFDEFPEEIDKMQAPDGHEKGKKFDEIPEEIGKTQAPDGMMEIPEDFQLDVGNSSSSSLATFQHTLEYSSTFLQQPNDACMIRLMEDRRDGATLDHQLNRFRGRLNSEVVAGVLQSLENGELALEFYQWAKLEAGFRHDTTTTNSLLFTLVRLGMSRRAYELFEQGCFHVDTFSVSTILYGLCASGELGTACEFMEKLKLGGISAPYPRIFSTLVMGLCNAGNIDRALKLVREYDADPRAYAGTYTILIKALCKIRRTKAAWLLFFEIVERGGTLDAAAYGELIYGLCKSGNISRACSLLEDMEARGCIPTVIIFTTLIDGFCKCRKVEQAVEVLAIMKNRGLTPDVVTFSALIDGLCKSGDMVKAVELLKVMVEAGCKPNVVTYSSIIDGFCKSRRMSDAVEWMEAMVSDGCDPDVVTYTSIIHGYCLQKNVDEAGRVFKQLVSAGLVPNHATYSSLVIGCFKAGEFGMAHSYLREMIERGSACNLAVYIDLIYGFCEGNCGVLLQYENRKDDCCVASDRVAPLFQMLRSMVEQGDLVLDDLVYDVRGPRRGRAEQIVEFMHRRGCLDEDSLVILQQGLADAAAIRDPPALIEKEHEAPFDI